MVQAGQYLHLLAHAPQAGAALGVGGAKNADVGQRDLFHGHQGLPTGPAAVCACAHGACAMVLPVHVLQEPMHVLCSSMRV